MAQKRKKADNRPWVDKDDIIVYDGTKESIDKIHAKAKKLGGFVDKAVYNTTLKRLMEFNLYLNSSEQPFCTVTYKSAVVFTESQILWYPTEKKALDAVRVRTGFTRVTVIFEQDDKIQELVVPRTYSPFFTTIGDNEDTVFEDSLRFHSNHQRMTIDLGQLVQDSDGVTHYVVDRVVQPDLVVPQFNEKLVLPDE